MIKAEGEAVRPVVHSRLVRSTGDNVGLVTAPPGGRGEAILGTESLL